MRRYQQIVIGLSLAACAFFPLNSSAAIKTELLVKTFSKPVFICAPPGDTDRLFVLEQHTGRIRIIDLATRTIKPTAFITITNLLTGSEQGLLGLAFHPGYRTNGYFYINQVSRGGTAGHTEISRYTVQGDPASSDIADRSTRKVLLSFDQPESNHNGGWMAFGPDGYLYISQGDGGGGNDMHGSPGNGQRLNTYLGKILRIDVDGGDPYSIPNGNPFRGSDSANGEIWAYGLRNPWRCSFDRATGDLWIGDVGQSTREEIDVAPAGVAGLNFGWRVREGSIQNPAYPGETLGTPAVDPVYDYSHSVGFSVTGGYVYRGSAISELRGKYLFTDYGSARFWTITPNGTNAVPAQEITAKLNNPKKINSPTSFGEDANGELYICDYDGEIYKMTSDSIQITALRSGASEFVVSFPSQAGQSYTLESKASLRLTDEWTVVTNLPASPSNGTQTLTNSLAGTERYFRVRAE